MGTRLICFLFFSFTATILSSGCSLRAYPKFDYDSDPNPWITAFKDKVFVSILQESYKHDSVFNNIKNRDPLIIYDGLSLDAIYQSRQLAKNFLKNIPPPTWCEDCSNGKNYFMAQALHYYRSRDLDIIARTAYRKFKKEERAYNLSSNEAY